MTNDSSSLNAPARALDHVDYLTFPKSIPKKTLDLEAREPRLYAAMAEHKRLIAALVMKSERDAAIDAVVEFGETTACRFVRNSAHETGEPQYVDMAKNDYLRLAKRIADFESLKWRCDPAGGGKYVYLKSDLRLCPRQLVNAIRAVRTSDSTPTAEEVRNVIQILSAKECHLSFAEDLLSTGNWLNFYGPQIEPASHGGLPQLHKTLSLDAETEGNDSRLQERYASYLETDGKPGGKGSRKRANAIRTDGPRHGGLANGLPIVLQYLTGHPLKNELTGAVEKTTPFAVLHPDDVPWIDAVLANLRTEGMGPFRWALLADHTVKIQSERSISLALEVWKLHHKEVPAGVAAIDGNPLNLWSDNLEEKAGR